MFGSLKAIIRKNQGSVAIVLSLVVSAGVLSTIYITQKIAGGFLSDLSQSMEDWEKHLVAKSAQTLAAYLVTNNLVMCREEGWQGKNANCQWSTVSNIENPSQFHLSDEVDSSKGLSYKGEYMVDDSEKEYKVTFNLVDWTDTSIQSLIGEIPEYVCRNKTDLSIISDATCIKYKDSSDPINQGCQRNGSDLANSVCEYVSMVDSDHWIVLTKVEVDYKDPVSKLEQTHTMLSGIRRPLSLIKFVSVISSRRCSRACSVGSVANPFPTCRGSSVPSAEGVYTGKASNIVTIKNEGPGFIYSLSLIRSSIRLADNSIKMDVTPDIVKTANREVFFPGKTIKFEYFYDCSIQVKQSSVYQTGSTDSVDVVVKNQLVPFEKFLYGFNFNAQNPKGMCYTAGQTGVLTPTNPGEVDFALVTGDDRRLASAHCAPGASSCSANGKTGTCQFVNLEPRRVFKIPSEFSVTHNKLVKNIVTTITTAPPPSSLFSPDGGDGADGADGVDGVGDGTDGQGGQDGEP